MGFSADHGSTRKVEWEHKLNNFKDYKNWLVRIDGYLDWLKSAKIKMQEGMKTGWVLPKSLIKKVLPQLKVMTNEDVENHLFYKPVTSFPNLIEEDEREILIAEYYDMVKNKIIPAYSDLYNLMSLMNEF